MAVPSRVTYGVYSQTVEQLNSGPVYKFKEQRYRDTEIQRERQRERDRAYERQDNEKNEGIVFRTVKTSKDEVCMYE